MKIEFVCQPVSDSLLQITAQGLNLEQWIATFEYVQSIQMPWGLSGELEIILADQSISCVLPYSWQLNLGVNPLVELLKNNLNSSWGPLLEKGISVVKAKLGKSASMLAYKPKLHCVPVQLGGDMGPDLPEVLKSLNLSVTEFSRLLFGAELTVQFLGFLPGFAYLTGLPSPLSTLKRRESPRLQVPPQSFAMAAGYCAVYPLQSPGGWHLLGASAINPFDVGAEQPALFKAGDKVRLVPMAADMSFQTGGVQHA